MVKRKRTLTDEDPETLPASNVSYSKEPAVLGVLPGITRKITACGACRKQKVRDESSVIVVEVNGDRSNVT
jgi:hypothetical protein